LSGWTASSVSRTEAELTTVNIFIDVLGEIQVAQEEGTSDE
jgi:hypothetical protein